MICGHINLEIGAMIRKDRYFYKSLKKNPRLTEKYEIFKSIHWVLAPPPPIIEAVLAASRNKFKNRHKKFRLTNGLN